jgi:hypothetical protein
MSYITVAVEGSSDAAIAQTLCSAAGLTLARAPIVAGGKGKLDPRLAGYNNAARLSPWLVLRDLDTDADCAAALCEALLNEPAPGMLLRVPVRSVETWLLADRDAIAKYLRVPVARVPAAPESLDRPKRSLVDVARHSRVRTIRDDMIPAARGVEVGPGYTGRVTEFALNVWNPDRASANSDSLERCLRRLRGRRIG